MAHDPFAPPPEDNRPLEIESEWRDEKAKKQATAVVHDPENRRSNAWIWIVLGVIVAGVVAAGVVVQLRSQKPESPATRDTEGTVGIEIRAMPPAQIRIDGHKAGKTPLTLHVRKSTTAVQIDNGKQTRSVIPDHDQLVDFTR